MNETMRNVIENEKIYQNYLENGHDLYVWEGVTGYLIFTEDGTLIHSGYANQSDFMAEVKNFNFTNGKAFTEEQFLNSEKYEPESKTPATKKNFYGFAFTDSRYTTTGQANTDTGIYAGSHSIAGDAVVFHCKRDRDDWLSEGSNALGNIRTATTRPQLRKLCAGMTKSQFEEYLIDIDFFNK